jgi:hypothetical protein
MRIRIASVLLVVFAVAAFVPLACAQGITGTITGVVSDATGGVVAGAHVTATRLDTNEARTATRMASSTFHCFLPGAIALR